MLIIIKKILKLYRKLSCSMHRLIYIKIVLIIGYNTFDPGKPGGPGGPGGPCNIKRKLVTKGQVGICGMT